MHRIAVLDSHVIHSTLIDMCRATPFGSQKESVLCANENVNITYRCSMKPLSPALPEAPSKYAMDNFSPVGLHVLVVDDDPLCLLVLEKMLKSCSYKVTTCICAKHALDILRDCVEDDIDLVLSDVYMPDVDGFKLLEIIGLELDLPVIMMSANGDTSVVMKGITHGACDYLIKPVRMEELRNIWQHVVRYKKKGIESPKLGPCSNTASTSSNELLENSPKKRKGVRLMGQGLVEGASILKRARVNWTVDLHQRFVDAVNQLGVEDAVPKKLLDVMNVKGLTRENVASHLQKYRLYLKRLSGVTPERHPIASFQASEGGKSGGTMRILPGGRSLNSVPPTFKGLNSGAGITKSNVCVQNLDAGAVRSLTVLKGSQQQQQRSANRAQVPGALGFVDSSCPVAAARRNSSLDLRTYFQVPQSHLLSSHLMPSSLGRYAHSGPDEMGGRPRDAQVEGFVSNWNINPVGRHDLGKYASADVQMQGHANLQGNPAKVISGDKRHARSEITQTGRYVEILEDTDSLRKMSLCTPTTRETNLDALDLVQIPEQQPNVCDYLLDEEF